MKDLDIALRWLATPKGAFVAVFATYAVAVVYRLCFPRLKDDTPQFNYILREPDQSVSRNRPLVGVDRRVEAQRAKSWWSLTRFFY